MLVRLLLAWFSPDLGWRNIWNFSVFHKKKASCLVLSMTCWVACRNWRQASLSLWIVKDLNPRLSLVVGLQISSLIWWILPSVVLRSALHQGKLPASWSFTYLLIFFCNSKFTAGFIYFYFLNNFLWIMVCQRVNTKPNTLWCGYQVVTSHVWQLADAQRVTYECWREEIVSEVICQFCSCVLGGGGHCCGKWCRPWQ